MTFRPRPRLALLAGCLAIAGLTVGLSANASADSVPAAAGEFVPVAATNVVDTTVGLGWPGQLQPDATNTISVTGVAGVPTTGVTAVMLQISTSNSTKTSVNLNGNVWVWPTGTTRPQYAVVANAPLNSVADNTAIVQVGSGGKISFYNGANGSPVDISADIEGYVTSAATKVSGATFAPLTPNRIIDTTDGTGGRATPLTSDAPWTFDVSGVGGIPASGVTAVVLNVGAVATSSNCWLQVQPTGTDPTAPGYPRVDTYATYTAQGFAVVAPDTNGDLTFSTNCTSTEIHVDVQGYYLTNINGSNADVFVPITTPTRIVDTRHNVGVTGKLTAGRVIRGTRAVAVRGVAGVPEQADAVALNLAAVNATAVGANTVWPDGTVRPQTTSVIADPTVINTNLAFVALSVSGKIDVADSSDESTQSNDMTIDVQGYFLHTTATDTQFGTAQYFPAAWGDTFYNTVDTNGNILATVNDTKGLDLSCGSSDMGMLSVTGSEPTSLSLSMTNCMTDFGPIAGGGPGHTPDGCSWKTGGITRIGQVIYVAVARQLNACSVGHESNGLQPSYNSSIIKSTDNGVTWTNAFGVTSPNGAAPKWDPTLGRFQAMFSGQTFPAPFFIQYGPGNTQTVDGGDKYLYAVSTDGYAYDGNYLHLARVPVNKVMTAGAWQFYHGRVGGSVQSWTNSPTGATRVLQARHGLSQPAIQYVPALKRYVMTTFYYTQPGSMFPTLHQTPYTRFEMYTSPKPWGPWTHVYDHGTQRSLWCTASPCSLTSQPDGTSLTVGTPDDWLGLYDPALVQKFVYTRPLSDQAFFTCGDWMNRNKYAGENLYRLHVLPFNLASVVGS
jgi:hypothetical protein